MDDTIAVQSLCFGLLILSAHFSGRLALKLKIGQMIGQLLGGVFVGPYFLEIDVRQKLKESMRQGTTELLLRPKN